MAEVGLSRSIMIDVPIGVTTDGRLTLCTRTQVAGATMGAGEDRSLEPDGGAVVAASTQNRLDPIAAAYDPSLDSLASLYGSADGAAVGDAHLTGLFELAEADVARARRRLPRDRHRRVVVRRLPARRQRGDRRRRLRRATGATRPLKRGPRSTRARRRWSTASARRRTCSRPASGPTTARLATAAGRRWPPADRPRQATRQAATDSTTTDCSTTSGTPLFVLGPDGEILTWNSQLEDLTGVSRGGSPVHGDGEHGLLSRRAARANPRGQGARCARGDRHGVRRAESRDADFTLYRDTSVMVDPDGEEVHISFSAAPIYDDDGALLGVVEMVQDRTDDALRHEQTAALVTELEEETMHDIQNGDLSARASFDNDGGHVDESLLAVVTELNEMARCARRPHRGRRPSANSLASATDQSADAAHDVEAYVTAQNGSSRGRERRPGRQREHGGSRRRRARSPPRRPGRWTRSTTAPPPASKPRQ